MIRYTPIALTILASCIERGGAEIVLSQLLLNLDYSRFHPRLVCLRQEPGVVARALQQQGIPLTYGLARMKYDPFVGHRVVRALAQTDLLLCLDHHQVLFWLPYVLRRTSIASTVLSCHATRNPDGGRIFHASEHAALQRMQRIIAVAHQQKQELVQRERIPAAQIVVIPNGVAVSPDINQAARREERAAVRQTWALQETHRVAMIVAQLRPEKNHAAFLRIARLVANHHPLARFVIVGDGPERAALERLRDALGLSSVVYFAGMRTDVPRLLTAADVVVLTSKTETLPMALLEAMAAGKPVIAPHVGSIAELICDGSNGYLIANGAEDQFASALLELLTNDEKARKMGTTGSQRVQQHFTLAHMVRNYEALFTTLLAERVSTAA